MTISYLNIDHTDHTPVERLDETQIADMRKRLSMAVWMTLQADQELRETLQPHQPATGKYDLTMKEKIAIDTSTSFDKSFDGIIAILKKQIEEKGK